MSCCANCAALEARLEAATKAMLAATCGPVERAEWETLVAAARSRALEANARCTEAKELLVYLLVSEDISPAARRRTMLMVERLAPGYFESIGMAKP